MTQPIREYLAQRRSDVQAQIKALRAELHDIDVAERALGTAGESPKKLQRGRSDPASGKKTLKEMALEALSTDLQAGADAQTILAWIKAKYGVDVARESLSPQLSRLGQDEIVTRDGTVWRLSQTLLNVGQDEPKKIEAPDGYQPSGASSSEEFDELLG